MRLEFHFHKVPKGYQVIGKAKICSSKTKLMDYIKHKFVNEAHIESGKITIEGIE